MSERDEGPLSDPQERQKKESADAKGRRIVNGDLRVLERMPEFRRWFGRFSEMVVTADIETTNGGELQKFVGRRSIILQMTREFERLVPGFYERVLAARRNYAQEIGLQDQPVEE